MSYGDPAKQLTEKYSVKQPAGMIPYLYDRIKTY